MSNKAKGIAKSLLKHRSWSGRIATGLCLEYYGREGRQRIEVISKISSSYREYILNVRCQCAKCGAAIYPFRQRLGSHNIYYAASCAMKDNYRCSRSKATADEYGRVVAALEEMNVKAAYS